MHGLGKINGVEYLDLVALLLLQEVAALRERTALWVYHHIGRMGLEKLGSKPETGLTRAGRADDTGV